MTKPSVVLLGSKPGSVAALALLLKRDWRIQYVVVSQGYEYEWVEKPTLQEFALSNKINVLFSQGEIPSDTKVDFVLSYMYRNLVVPRTLNMAKRGALNFHAGPLPEFGGWAFYNIAILEGANEYGCTCHYMDEGFDTGPILSVERFPINAEEETAFSLEKKAQIKMIKMFFNFCEQAESGKKLPSNPQDPEKMRYMSKQEFEKLKEIPLNAAAKEIDLRARAFWYPPYGCAFIKVSGQKIEIIPDIAKLQVATSIHSNDLSELLTAVNIT